jgi:hypothetical protein
MDSGAEVMPAKSGHGNEIGVIAFSRDGKWLSTGSADHTMQLWDLSSGRPALVFRHRGPIDGVSFGDSGRQVATYSLEGITVNALSIPDLVRRAEKRVTRPLSPWECQEYLGPMRFWLSMRAWWKGRGSPCA